MKTCLSNLRIYPNDKDYSEGSLLIEDDKILGIYSKDEEIIVDR